MKIENQLEQALRLQISGKYLEAEKIYRAVLEKEPDNADANNYLGSLYCQTGKFEDALRLIAKSIEINPERYDYYQNMGVVYEKLQRHGDSEASYSKALSLKPGDPQILYNLGNCQQKQRKFNQAINAYKRVLEIRTDDHAAYFNLGNCYMQTGHFANAKLEYEKSLSIFPGNVEVLFRLGIANGQLNKFEDAVKQFQKVAQLRRNDPSPYYYMGICYLKLAVNDKAENAFREAIRLEPRFALAYNSLGRLLYWRGETSEAVQALEKSVAIDEKYIEGWINLGFTYEQINNLEKARRCAETALELSPDHPSAQRLSGILLRREGKINESLSMMEKIRVSESSLEEKMLVNFELGKLYDRVGKFDKAFQCFVEGNRIQINDSNARRFDKDRFVAIMHHNRIKTGNADKYVSRVTKERKKGTPSFLIGFPRSGTTLTGRILNSHPDIRVMDELPLINPIVTSLMTDTGNYHDALDNMTPSEVEDIQSVYLRNIEKQFDAPSPGLLVDKNPLNIVHAGLIRRIFPDAKFILIVRHPYDCCLSGFMQLFLLNDAMANFASLPDAARFYHQVMVHWQEEEPLIKPLLHVMKYEDLVDDFECEVGRLLEFVGVNWHDGVKDFHKPSTQEVDVITPSYHQVSEPLYSTAKYRWKNYEKYFKDIRPLLDPSVEYFGYPE